MNVLIIGLGSIGKKHVVALNCLQDKYPCKIYALRSNINSANEDGITNIYSLDDANLNFDFVIISNPTYLHTTYIAFFSDKGIPLFIEKPVSNSMDNLRELTDRIVESNLKTYIGCNLRFHPCIIFLKTALSKERIKEINEVNVYCGSYLPTWRSGVDYKNVYSAHPDMGGGVHLDLFHELDYMVWLFGLPLSSSSLLRSVSSLAVDSIDYANYSLQYTNYTASVILNYYRKQPKRTLEIVFTDSVWIVDLVNATIKNSDGDDIFSDKNFKMADTYVEQMSYFINFINGNFDSMNPIDESIEILEICLAR